MKKGTYILGRSCRLSRNVITRTWRRSLTTKFAVSCKEMKWISTGCLLVCNLKSLLRNGFPVFRCNFFPVIRHQPSSSFPDLITVENQSTADVFERFFKMLGGILQKQQADLGGYQQLRGEVLILEISVHRRGVAPSEISSAVYSLREGVVQKRL